MRLDAHLAVSLRNIARAVPLNGVQDAVLNADNLATMPLSVTRRNMLVETTERTNPALIGAKRTLFGTCVGYVDGDASLRGMGPRSLLSELVSPYSSGLTVLRPACNQFHVASTLNRVLDH